MCWPTNFIDKFGTTEQELKSNWEQSSAQHSLCVRLFLDIAHGILTRSDIDAWLFIGFCRVVYLRISWEPCTLDKGYCIISSSGILPRKWILVDIWYMELLGMFSTSKNPHLERQRPVPLGLRVWLKESLGPKKVECGNSHSVPNSLSWVDLIQYLWRLWWPNHGILR